jgi:hypothetical protein
VQYVVTRDHGQWAIRHGGQRLGPYASCPHAIRAAVEQAALASQAKAEVVVERSPFDRYVVWIQGRDGFFR